MTIETAAWSPPPRSAGSAAAVARATATGGTFSARNRMPGIVRSVEVDGVMALVEIEAGPFLITAAVTRDSVEELGLAPGVEATATVKATSVMVARGAGQERVEASGPRMLAPRLAAGLRFRREQSRSGGLSRLL